MARTQAKTQVQPKKAAEPSSKPSGKLRPNSSGAVNAWDKPSKAQFGWMGPPPGSSNSSGRKESAKEKEGDNSDEGTPVQKTSNKQKGDSGMGIVNGSRRPSSAGGNQTTGRKKSAGQKGKQSSLRPKRSGERAPERERSQGTVRLSAQTQGDDGRKPDTAIVNEAAQFLNGHFGFADADPDSMERALLSAACDDSDGNPVNEKKFAELLQASGMEDGASAARRIFAVAPGRAAQSIANLLTKPLGAPLEGPLSLNRPKLPEQGAAIKYSECSEPVYGPSGWDPSITRRSAERPEASMKRRRVVSGCETRCGLGYTGAGDIVYCSRTFGVVLDPDDNEESFLEAKAAGESVALDVLQSKVTVDGRPCDVGQIIATAHTDPGDGSGPSVAIWDAQEPTIGCLREVRLGKGKGKPTALKFSDDGDLIAVSCSGDASLAFFNWRSCRLVFSAKGPGKSYATGLAWHTSSALAAVGPGGAALWHKDPEGDGEYCLLKCKISLQETHLTACCCLPPHASSTEEAPMVITGSSDGQLHAFRDGTHVRSSHPHSPGSNSRFPGVRNLEVVAGSQMVSTGGDGRVTAWRIDGSKGVLSSSLKIGEWWPLGKGIPIAAAAFSIGDEQAEQERLALLTHTGRLVEWTKGTGATNVLKPALDESACVACWVGPSAYSEKLAVSGSYGQIAIFNADGSDMEGKSESNLLGEHCKAITASWRGLGSHGEAHMALCAGGQGKARVISLGMEGGDANHWVFNDVALLQGSGSPISCAAFGPQGKIFAIAHEAGIVRCFKPRENYALSCTISCQASIGCPKSLDFSLDASVLQVAAHRGGSIRFFESRSGSEVSPKAARDIELKTHRAVVGFCVMGLQGSKATCCDRSPGNGSAICVGTAKGELRLYNYPCVIKDAPNIALKAHNGAVSSVAFSPTGSSIVSCAANGGEIAVWRCEGVQRESAVSDALPCEGEEEGLDEEGEPEEEREDPVQARARRLQEARRQAEEAERMARMGAEEMEDPYGFDPALGAAEQLLEIERNAFDHSDF